MGAQAFLLKRSGSNPAVLKKFAGSLQAPPFAARGGANTHVARIMHEAALSFCTDRVKDAQISGPEPRRPQRRLISGPGPRRPQRLAAEQQNLPGRSTLSTADDAKSLDPKIFGSAIDCVEDVRMELRSQHDPEYFDALRSSQRQPKEYKMEPATQQAMSHSSRAISSSPTMKSMGDENIVDIDEVGSLDQIGQERFPHEEKLDDRLHKCMDSLAELLMIAKQ